MEKALVKIHKEQILLLLVDQQDKTPKGMKPLLLDQMLQERIRAQVQLLLGHMLVLLTNVEMLLLLENLLALLVKD